MLKTTLNTPNILVLATFNIRCFGYSGNYHSQNKSEHRLVMLRSFLKDNFSDCDIIILQEIMDLSLLKKVFPDDYKFYYYSHTYPRHMHIVFVCKPEFDFADITVIPNTALDQTKSRPILHGKLRKHGLFISHIFGVHLKSGYEHTSKRIFQAQTLKEYISKQTGNDPVVVAGDFNSHNKQKTKQNQDDLYYLNDIFNNVITHHPHHKKTYILPLSESELDHVWTHKFKVQEITVYDPKNYSSYNSIKKYYDEVSDHLPVKAKLILGL